MKISKIHIKNFRKLKNCTLNFGEKQTILVGANNSGKTSCMQAIVSFLKDSKRFTTKDFTLSNWEHIDNIADKWVHDENSKPKLEDIIDELPQIDVWIEVESKEAYLVRNLIPSLEWEGKTVGVRIIYAPKDIEKLYAEYKNAYSTAQNIKKREKGNINIDIYPNDIFDYLNRGRLNLDFSFKYYILDIKKESKDDDEIQPLPDIEFEDGNPLEKIIKIDHIDAQRDFSDPDSSDHSSQNTLSKQLQSYYDKNIKPKESQVEEQDLGLLEAMQTANQTLDKKIGEAFKHRIDELKKFNYPGFHDPSIEIHSFVDIKDSINHESAVQFALNGDDEGLSLPESYNGLGFQNLISMYFRLIQFRDEWLHEGRMEDVGVDGKYIEPIHLVFIEEPEAHLHAQAQQVFIKKAYEVLCKHKTLSDNNNYTTQLVLSTHSNHIVHDVSLNDMRYFHREISTETKVPISTIVNLTGVFGQDDKTEKFVTRYIRLSQCDFFFADAVILVEGSAERILMPHFLENENMSSNYISVIEINGSHAHRFKNLVEKLNIPCLIVTDIDAQSKDENGKYSKDFTKKGNDQKTNNDTLKKWLPMVEKIDDLLDLEIEKKVEGNVMVTYQTGISVKLKNNEEIAYPYTFEDALALSNIELFKQDNLEVLGLVTNFNNIIKTCKNVEECCEKMFNTLTPGKKSPFAINLLYLEQFDKLKTPSYIKDGLVWLNNKLNVNIEKNDQY